MAGSHSERQSSKSSPFLSEWVVATLFAVVSIVVIFVILGAIIFNPFTESGRRGIKSLQSDWGGGLERTVTVYDEYGDVLQEWHGTFDISNNDQEVYFDFEGRRVVIHGGVVIVQEETEEEWQARVAQRNG